MTPFRKGKLFEFFAPEFGRLPLLPSAAGQWQPSKAKGPPNMPTTSRLLRMRRLAPVLRALVLVAIVSSARAQAADVKTPQRSLDQVTPSGNDGFSPLEGQWACAGRFIATGAPMRARIGFERDAKSGGLIVRHDDEPPGSYHALEIWSANQRSGLRAAIVDSLSGMRWFAATGWTNDILTWVRTAAGRPAEQFAYTLTRGGELRIDWSVVRQSGVMTLGDTLSCHHIKG